jgi:ribosome-binding protein aMBF1 (putative translation factor)
MTRNGNCRKCGKPLRQPKEEVVEKTIVEKNAHDAPNICSHVGEAIRDIRLKKGWSQQDLAKKMGTEQSYVSQIESGSIIPGIPFLVSMVIALGIPLSALFSSIEFREGLIDEHPF